MVQEFYIRKNSQNPLLRMEVINDGRYDYRKSALFSSLLDSTVTFSMRNVETGLLKVAKAKAEIVEAITEGCEEKYVLQYRWNKRDTKEEGVFEGWFDISFNGDVIDNGAELMSGAFRVPIQERLLITIY